MNKKKIQIEYREKISLINKFNKSYYDDNKPKVNDQKYDELKKEILELEKKYSTLRCEKYVYMYIKKLQNYLKTTNTLASHDTLQQFKQVNKSLDDVRNESSWKVVLPELAEILDE